MRFQGIMRLHRLEHREIGGRGEGSDAAQHVVLEVLHEGTTDAQGGQELFPQLRGRAQKPVERPSATLRGEELVGVRQDIVLGLDVQEDLENFTQASAGLSSRV